MYLIMDIEKAIDHFTWKFKNSWKPTKKDIEAFNAILDFKEHTESVNLQKNDSLAKLWIHQLILFARSGSYDGERCIQVLDGILERSVYDWCMVLKKEIPMMRFNSVGSVKYPLEPMDYFNITKLDERNEKIVKEFETELTEAMKYEISEEDIIKFVKRQITRVLNIYEFDNI